MGHIGARFHNRVAIVTGGAKGIGRACAEYLAREGASVVVADVNESEATKTADELRSTGAAALAASLNVADERSIEEGFALVRDRHGRLDILVNSAGVFDDTPPDQLDPERWRQVLDVNLIGTFLCCKAAMAPMRAQKYGRIINIGSIGGKVGGPVSGASYAASKAAVMCLTKSLARFLARDGVTVNSVSPGVIATDMTRNWSSANVARTIQNIPLGTLGKPRDVAAAVAFLASEDAGYITGEILDVNGGQLMD